MEDELYSSFHEKMDTLEATKRDQAAHFEALLSSGAQETVRRQLHAAPSALNHHHLPRETNAEASPSHGYDSMDPPIVTGEGQPRSTSADSAEQGKHGITQREDASSRAARESGTVTVTGVESRPSVVCDEPVEVSISRLDAMTSR